MILDNKSMRQLIRQGVNVVGSDAKPIMKNTSEKASSNSIAITLEKNESEVEAFDSMLGALTRIEGVLSKILSKPTPDVIVKPPDVIVNPPEVIVKPPNVIVNPPAVISKPPDVIVKAPEVTVQAPTIPPLPKQIRKWHFALKKDQWGTTEITATAIE